MTNPFKGMTKEEKKKFRKLVKIISCDLNCDKCKKIGQHCIKDIRFCLNILLKERLQNIKKNKEKQNASTSMVS